MKNDAADWRIELIAIITCPIWIPLLMLAIGVFAVISLGYDGVLWLIAKAPRRRDQPEKPVARMIPPPEHKPTRPICMIQIPGCISRHSPAYSRHLLLLRLAQDLADGTLTEEQVASQVPPEEMRHILATVKAAKAECSGPINPRAMPLVRLGPGGQFVRDYPDVHEVRRADPEPPY